MGGRGAQHTALQASAIRNFPTVCSRMCFIERLCAAGLLGLYLHIADRAEGRSRRHVSPPDSVLSVSRPVPVLTADAEVVVVLLNV